MTTGATIHTSAGLQMHVSRRHTQVRQPPQSLVSACNLSLTAGANLGKHLSNFTPLQPCGCSCGCSAVGRGSCGTRSYCPSSAELAAPVCSPRRPAMAPSPQRQHPQTRRHARKCRQSSQAAASDPLLAQSVAGRQRYVETAKWSSDVWSTRPAAMLRTMRFCSAVLWQQLVQQLMVHECADCNPFCTAALRAAWNTRQQFLGCCTALRRCMLVRVTDDCCAHAAALAACLVWRPSWGLLCAVHVGALRRYLLGCYLLGPVLAGTLPVAHLRMP
jgi:hypothetical protein